MNLKDIVFGLFGSYEAERDVNKNLDPDGQKRGTLERFVRACAEEYDDNFSPAIVNLLDNTLIPEKALVKFLPYLENELGLFGGGELVLFNTEASRRKVLKHILQLYKIKGTNTAFRILFKMLGFTGVTITETYPGNSFDSEYTLDDPGRRFDGSCPSCSNYYLDLLGSVTMTPALIQGIYSVIRWNEPINARLKGVTYNGDYLVDKIISIEVNALGDLVYANEYDPELVLTMKDGDLLVNGPNKARYRLDENGDLIYTV